MAESVDASVSNTDRETCAGSTPARSTKQALHNLLIVERFFYSVGVELNSYRSFHSLFLSRVFCSLAANRQKKGAHLTNWCVDAFPLWV